MQFGINKHEYIFQRLTKLHEPVGRVQFVVFEKIYECLFIPNCTRKIIWLLVNNNFEMVKQKERTRITQSGKNCAMNCAIQVKLLIWKKKIWLAICEFLFSNFPVNQFNFKFLHSVSTFWTQFQLFALNFNFLHCLGLTWS